jgi:threonine/homoserine/homoserine lactone efflux protein
MKAMLIVITGPAMLFFTIAAISTVEFHAEYGGVYPWAWIIGIGLMDIVWCVGAQRCSREEMNRAYRRYEKFLDNIFTNKLKNKDYDTFGKD